ncbi:DUF58 domain-containing protein [Psychromonas sp. MME2]|uniref:DUF58 domain-containing protein n=1 Tax=unclassified Psychromonas TaxID=2614957 RepID=UPI00339C01CF
MPAQTSFTLNHKNSFIFPSLFGLYFLLLCFVLFLLGTNYENNLILFLVFFLCSFMVTCLLLTYQNIAQLTFTATPVNPQFAGQDVAFCLRILRPTDNGKKLDINFQKSVSTLRSVISEQQVVLYSFCKQRGYFSPGRVTVRSTFPFGLFTVWTHLDFAHSVLLYPEPINNERALLSSSSLNNYSGMSNYAVGFEQFSMLKSYQPGESLKSVAWKQLAQGRGWFSKQFEQSQAGDVFLDIDLYPYLELEEKLSLLCYQIIELHEKHCSYGLKLGNDTIANGHGMAQKEACLKALALYGTSP